MHQYLFIFVNLNANIEDFLWHNWTNGKKTHKTFAVKW